MPGVKSGDIGPKIGFNSKNNGWATFDHVRIPRDWMPMKFVEVDREGNFNVIGDPRDMYAAMTLIRLTIAQHSAGQIYTALLIALRYSAVRRQFKNTPGSDKETKLLDYQT